jgi:DNA polymerase lambda
MKANVLGYSLNQRGLFAGIVRNPRNRHEKLNKGNVTASVVSREIIVLHWLVGYVIASETEEEIFKILGVPWQEPHERVRG